MKHFTIESVTIIQREGHTDLVKLHTDVPSPIVCCKSDRLTFEFQATQGKGLEYLSQYLGIEDYPGSPCPIEVIRG